MDRQYFLAIIPPEPLYSEIMELKNYCKLNFNTSGALRSPPHITLHMPFKWSEEKQSELERSLEATLAQQPAIDISIDGFGSFQPRVIFANVHNSDQLDGLHNAVKAAMKKVQVFNPSYKDRGFTPHMTIAFRDLKKPAFRLAWDHFKDEAIADSFAASSIWLLKHTGKKWVPEHEVHLKD